MQVKLSTNGRPHSRDRRIERGIHRVAYGLKYDSTVRLDRSLHERVVARERHRIGARVLPKKPCAALDITKEEDDRASGQFGHPRSIGRRRNHPATGSPEGIRTPDLFLEREAP